MHRCCNQLNGRCLTVSVTSIIDPIAANAQDVEEHIYCRVTDAAEHLQVCCSLVCGVNTTIGPAAFYGVTTTVSAGNTSLITSGSVYAWVTAQLRSYATTNSLSSFSNSVSSLETAVSMVDDVITTSGLSNAYIKTLTVSTQLNFKGTTNYITSDSDDYLDISTNNVIWLDSNDIYVEDTIGDAIGDYSNWYIDKYGSAEFASVAQSSDATLKNIISDVARFDVKDIVAASVVYFTWIYGEDPTDEKLGTVAQYWKTIAPQCVRGEEGKMRMDYSSLGLVSSIINAREIVKHEDEINALKQRVKALEIKLAAYEI